MRRGLPTAVIPIHHSSFSIQHFFDSAAADRAVHHAPGVEVGELVLHGFQCLGPAGLLAFPAERLPGLGDLRLALLALALAVPLADLGRREVLAVLLVDALE